MTTSHIHTREFEMSESERQRVLLEIYGTLGRLSPGIVSPEETTGPGGLEDLERNLDAIVDNVYRATAGQIEHRPAQFPDDICTCCPHQHPGGSCPLRRSGSCVLLRFPETIVGAVRKALGQIIVARQVS